LGAAVAGAALVAAAACLHPTQPTSVCTQVAAYNIGDVVNDSLASGDCAQGNGALADYYQFTTTGQQDLRVSVSSPGMLTFLQLYDQRGAIVMNSAVTSTVDTTTTVRLKIAAGTWALAVNAVNAGSSGHYRLTTAPDTAAVRGCGTVWITPGILTTQTISNADCTNGPNGGNFYYHLYTVVLLQNTEVNLSEHATAFAPAMYLVGPTGTTASTPDSLGTTALIQATIPTQGAYDLWVGSANANQFGTYTLQIK
jgi:hypothetical protein